MYRRRYAFLTLIAFLLAQFAVTLHQAEHGFEKHEHHGKLCDFYYFAEQSKVGDIPIPPLLVVPPVYSFRLALPEAQILGPFVLRAAAVRAPPFLLQS